MTNYVDMTEADVTAEIAAAVASERAACVNVAEKLAAESRTARDNFRAIGADADADRHEHYYERAVTIAKAIWARGDVK